AELSGAAAELRRQEGIRRGGTTTWRTDTLRSTIRPVRPISLRHLGGDCGFFERRSVGHGRGCTRGFVMAKQIRRNREASADGRIDGGLLPALAARRQAYRFPGHLNQKALDNVHRLC